MELLEALASDILLRKESRSVEEKEIEQLKRVHLAPLLLSACVPSANARGFSFGDSIWLQGY